MNDKFTIINITNSIAFFLTCSLVSDISNACMSISLAMGSLYVIYDCVRNRNLKKLYFPKKIWLGLAIFLGAVFLSSVFSLNIFNIKLAFNYIYWFLPFLLILYFAQCTNIKYSVILGIVVATILTGSHALYQFFTFPLGTRIGGFSYNPNFYAVLLVETLPILIVSLKDKRIYRSKIYIFGIILAIVLGVFSLFLTGSRGGILGFFVGLFISLFIYCFTLKKWKVLFIAILVILGIGGGIVTQGIVGGMNRSYDYERIYLQKSSIQMWEDHKILGVGLHNWVKEYQEHYIMPQTKEKKLTYSHNVITWFFSATGIIGGIGYLFFMIYPIYVMIRFIRKYGLNYYVLAGLWLWIGVSLHGMVDVGITMKSAARVAALCLGFCMVELQNCKKINL